MAATIQKKVWVYKRFEGVWDVPRNYKSLGYKKPHDYVLAELVKKHGPATRSWKLIIAPLDGKMEASYAGLERSA